MDPVTIGIIIFFMFIIICKQQLKIHSLVTELDRITWRMYKTRSRHY